MPDLKQDEGPKADLDLCTGPKDAYVVEVMLITCIPTTIYYVTLCCSEHYCHVYCLLSIFTTLRVLKHEQGYSLERKV